MAKILAWIMFAASAACFTTVFYRQQMEVRMEENAQAYMLPSPQWPELQRNAELWQVEDEKPTTQPGAASPVVAGADMGDALK